VSLSFSHDLELFALGSTHNIIVEVTSALPSVVGNIKLSLPAGWKAKPSLYFFKIQEVGSHVDFSFAITAPKKASRANIMAVASIGGVSYSSTRFEIRYDHIPQQLLQPPASLKVLSLKLKIHGRRIGYVPGAGDLVAESLERMGYETTELTDSDLSVERLKSFDAIVMGVRAVNVRSDLAQRMPALLEYVRRGGVLVTQYNTPDTLQTKDFFPYSLSLSNDRVTDPNAPVTILNPKLPIFTYPNVISASDFEGWVQERGRNFPDEWDSHYTPLLTIKDQTGLGKSGSLLVAHYGKGYYVYTGLSFFRQLPEGVRGAFRLFANLLSLK
jgi:hypothetical protein